VARYKHFHLAAKGVLNLAVCPMTFIVVAPPLVEPIASVPVARRMGRAFRIAFLIAALLLAAPGLVAAQALELTVSPKAMPATSSSPSTMTLESAFAAPTRYLPPKRNTAPRLFTAGDFIFRTAQPQKQPLEPAAFTLDSSSPALRDGFSPLALQAMNCWSRRWKSDSVAMAGALALPMMRRRLDEGPSESPARRSAGRACALRGQGPDLTRPLSPYANTIHSGFASGPCCSRQAIP
jgi:hypothetical protein